MYTQRSIMLPCPVVDVFAFLGNPQNWPLIEPGLVEYRHLAGPLSTLGARYLSRQERWGKIAETPMQVTEYVPNKIIMVEGEWANGVRPGGGFSVEAVAGGTQITTFVKVGARGIARLIVPLMTPMFTRSLDTILINLQRVLMQQDARV